MNAAAMPSCSCVSQVDHQLRYLHEQNQMAQADVESRLRIAFQLLRVFRRIYPHCLLVPFGSIISGPGTQISDCDFSLVRHPTPHLSHVLSGPRYFSPQLIPIVESLEKEYGISMCPEPPSGVATPTPVPFPSVPHSREKGPVPLTKNVKETKAILSEVAKVVCEIEASRVHSIPHARCPIVKFYHEPTSLECDLSVDQWCVCM